MIRKKFKKFILLGFWISLIAISNNSTTNVHADSIYSNENTSIKKLAGKKNVSTIKNWTIRFKNPIDINSLFQSKVITVTDSQGNLMNVDISTGDNEKCVYVKAPDRGYKEGQTYYLNISTSIKFVDETKALKTPIQMEFTTKDIGTLNLDETKAVASANNTFGFSLIKQLIAKDKSKNIIVSPLSITTILGMTQNGSDGETKQEMLNCIGLENLSDKDINSQYYSLLDYYNNLKRVNLKAADSIWVNKQIEINKDFKDLTEKYYSAQVDSEDFSNEDTVNKINKWVNQATNGQINKIIDRLDGSEAAVLINSLYFKGRWKHEFLPNNTRKEDFTLSNGKKISVDNMERRGYVNYLQGNNFQAVSLPYYDGIEMNIFLPSEGINIDSFMQGITKENFDKWVSSFEDNYVIQQIPKFKMDYDTELKETLETLGMKQPFDEHKANFTKFANNVTENPIYISEIKHKACISVDEQGTEAAAVTAEMMAGSAAPSGEPIEFKINRPFFFVIKDSNAGAILFMGKVENPQ